MRGQVIALLAQLQGNYLMHRVLLLTADFSLCSVPKNYATLFPPGPPSQKDGMTYMAGRGSSILSVGNVEAAVSLKQSVTLLPSYPPTPLPSSTLSSPSYPLLPLLPPPPPPILSFLSLFKPSFILHTNTFLYTTTYSIIETDLSTACIIDRSAKRPEF